MLISTKKEKKLTETVASIFQSNIYANYFINWLILFTFSFTWQEIYFTLGFSVLIIVQKVKMI